MKKYRVYSVDGRGGISGDRMIDAKDDDDAIFAVRSMQRVLDTEVWDLDRRVAKIRGYAI
jgi:hypothetical protein